MNKKSALFKIGYNTAAQLLGRFLSASLSAVSVALLTRYLGVSGYGDFSLIFAFLTFFVAFSDFGLQTTIVNLLSKKTFDQKEIFGTYLSLKIALIAFSIIISFLILFFLPYSSFVKLAIVFSSIGIGIGALGGFGNTFFQYNLRMDFISILDVLNRFIAVLLIAVFIYLELGFFAILSSVLISNIVSVSLMFIMLRSITPIRLSFRLDLAKKLLKLSIPIGIAYYLSVSYFKLDTLILSIFRNSSEVGIYTLSYKVFENATILWVFYVSSLYPFLSRFYHEENFGKIKELLRKTIFIAISFSIVIVFVGYFSAPVLVRIFGGENFAPSVISLRILLFSIFFVCLNLVFFTYLFIKNKTNLILYSLILTLAFNFLVNLIVIPRFGYIGASYATLATEIFLLSCYLFFSRKDPSKL